MGPRTVTQCQERIFVPKFWLIPDRSCERVRCYHLLHIGVPRERQGQRRSRQGQGGNLDKLALLPLSSDCAGDSRIRNVVHGACHGAMREGTRWEQGIPPSNPSLSFSPRGG